MSGEFANKRRRRLHFPNEPHVITATSPEMRRSTKLAKQSDPILKAIMLLISHISEEDRVALGRRLVGDIQRRRPVDDIPDAVTAIVRSGCGDVASIISRITTNRPQVDPKRVYNAVNYLVRRGELERIAHGLYRARPTAPVSTATGEEA